MNITLIGMPGSGKSTTGTVLAQMLGLYFLDTDAYIEGCLGRSLQEIVDQTGDFTLIEESFVLEATAGLTDTVIATGGSVIYSDRAMRHLLNTSLVVFLDVPTDTLLERINKQGPRGIDFHGHKNFHELHRARLALYQQYAHVVFAGTHTVERAAASIAAIAQTFIHLDALEHEIPVE